jgi:hypothetical protein
MKRRGVVRRGDWHSRLNAFIDGVKRKPFDWTANNCGEHFAAGAVLAMTDEDIAAKWRGRYSTSTAAIRMMKKDGFSSLGDMVASVLPEVHPSQAKLGDIASVPVDGPFGASLGVVNGEVILVLGEQSMGVVPLARAERVFAVG